LGSELKGEGKVEDIFIQNENQRAILETVKRFADAEVRPKAAALDANTDPAASFSWEIVEKANAMGIRTMTLDEKWGGLGTDALTTSMVIEELGTADLGVSVIFAQTLKIAQIMQQALSEEQQKRNTIASRIIVSNSSAPWALKLLLRRKLIFIAQAK
jgi:alkylation response protein AidB-like acyl-CoA dehydrogenase